MKWRTVKVIGLGGIGGCLVRVLLKYLNSLEDGYKVTLIDGDSFASENIDRQWFDRPGRKAQVVADYYMLDHDALDVLADPRYVTQANVQEIVKEGDVVFVCVDNHNSRSLISKHGVTLRDVLIISGGNEITDGNVQIQWRRAGRNMTLPIANEYHPEIVTPRDQNPGDQNCADRAAEGEPQLLLANNMAAACMLNAFWAWQNGRLDYDEVCFDVSSGNTRAIKLPRKKQRRKAHG